MSDGLYRRLYQPVICERVSAATVCGVPVIERPSGCAGQNCSEKRSWMWSETSSACIAISSSMTSRSLSTSAAVQVAEVIMSQITSTASGRSVSSTRA